LAKAHQAHWCGTFDRQPQYHNLSGGDDEQSDEQPNEEPDQLGEKFVEGIDEEYDKALDDRLTEERDQPDEKSVEGTDDMSSSRKRGGQRQEAPTGEELDMWRNSVGDIKQAFANEAKAKMLNQQIFDLEETIAAKKNAGTSKPRLRFECMV
jgi:hypothetical protein